MSRFAAGWVGVGVVAVALMGCAGSTLSLVKDPAQRFDASGFSVTAPPGINWYVVVTSTAEQLYFRKRLGDALVPTLIAVAGTATVQPRPTRAEDLVPFKQRSLEELQQRAPNFAIVIHDLRVDRALGAECVRWIQEETQRNHPHPALRSAVLVTTTYGLDCLHPLDQRSIITIGYSERRIAGATSLIAPGEQLAAEGEAFIQSIRFMRPR